MAPTDKRLEGGVLGCAFDTDINVLAHARYGCEVQFLRRMGSVALVHVSQSAAIGCWLHHRSSSLRGGRSTEETNTKSFEQRQKCSPCFKRNFNAGER